MLPQSMQDRLRLKHNPYRYHLSNRLILAAPDSLVAVPATFAPCATKVFAIALPIPRLAPVIRTTLPSNEK